MSSILHESELSSLFLFSLVSLMSVEGCQAESYPLLWRPLLRRHLFAHMTIQASSSIGRAAVSKTAGWGFDSLLACQPSPGWYVFF